MIREFLAKNPANAAKSAATTAKTGKENRSVMYVNRAIFSLYMQQVFMDEVLLQGSEIPALYLQNDKVHTRHMLSVD